jgi:hypothetical protein
VVDALIVVVHSHGQDSLRVFLANNMVIQVTFDFQRFGNFGNFRERGAFLSLLGFEKLFIQDFVAKINAFIADIDFRPSDELFDLVLALAAKRTL